jgi:DNA-binding protein HU-beta
VVQERKENGNMNKGELIEVVSSKTEITKAEAGRVVSAVLDGIVDGLKADGKVVLPGFGSFEVRSRTARVGRNPRTGENIKIKATKVPAFKAGKGMKEAVAKKK